MPDANDSAPDVNDVSAPDRSALRRRRRLLYGFAALALLAIVAAAAIQLIASSGDDNEDRPSAPPAPLVVERFRLLPPSGGSARGLAELLKRTDREGLRVLATGLKPTTEGERYQLLLTGGGKEPKLLGNQVVGANKIFVGEAKVSSSELHDYRFIDIVRLGAGSPPEKTVALRGRIPR